MFHFSNRVRKSVKKEKKKKNEEIWIKETRSIVDFIILSVF